MKKITLLLSAMLFSVMSYATVITFDADVDKGNAGTDSNNAAAYTITKDGVTVTVSSGILGTYNNVMHYRIYKGQTLTVTSTVGAITSVEFTCTANDDVKYGPGCFTWSTGNYTYSGAKGTWSGSAAEVVFTASSNQVRATEIVVAIDGSVIPDNGGDDNGGSTPVEPEKPEAKPLTDGYTKVTNISELANDDKVVLYCDAYAVGVAGFDGDKSGIMAETGWVEYVVELVEGGLKLKDVDQYIALTGKNSFRYNAAGSVLNVTENAMLSSVLEEKTYLLYRNANTQYNNPLCRMYVDKSGESEYAPFYVYKVTTTTAVEDVTVVEMPVKVIQNGQVLIKRGENFYNLAGVQVK